MCGCGCRCVVVLFILDSREDVAAEVTHEEGHTGFLHLPSAVLALIFLARRIHPFLSLVDREVAPGILCTKADSYGNEKLIRKWTKSVFFFFNLMGTRMVQIRIAESV